MLREKEKEVNKNKLKIYTGTFCLLAPLLFQGKKEPEALYQYDPYVPFGA